MGKAIQQSRCHLGIAKDAGPFTGTQVGSDLDASAFVDLVSGGTIRNRAIVIQQRPVARFNSRSWRKRARA
jgi:hypothetical protein